MHHFTIFYHITVLLKQKMFFRFIIAWYVFDRIIFLHFISESNAKVPSFTQETRKKRNYTSLSTLYSYSHAIPGEKNEFFCLYLFILNVLMGINTQFLQVIFKKATTSVIFRSKISRFSSHLSSISHILRAINLKKH